MELHIITLPVLCSTVVTESKSMALASFERTAAIHTLLRTSSHKNIHITTLGYYKSVMQGMYNKKPSMAKSSSLKHAFKSSESQQATDSHKSYISFQATFLMLPARRDWELRKRHLSLAACIMARVSRQSSSPIERSGSSDLYEHNTWYIRISIFTVYLLPIAASHAFKLPTTANEMMGLMAYEMVKNFAMASFSLCEPPFTSERAVSFMAGGPVGMSINANQRIGSSESTDVLAAMK